MTKFVPLVDTNNKTVLQWTMVQDNGFEIVKDIPKELWKLQSEWSEDDLHSLFSVDIVETVQEEQVIEAVIDEDTLDRDLELSQEPEKKTFS
jgi:hypothetical protein